ncbi:Uncharacterised protein [Yersinia enterocolitica]|nr:Uncharacterised protein [Yersinia enterocolitica]
MPFLLFVLEAAGLLASLTYPNHLLVIDLEMNRLIGTRSLAAYLQLQLL